MLRTTSLAIPAHLRCALLSATVPPSLCHRIHQSSKSAALVKIEDDRKYEAPYLLFPRWLYYLSGMWAIVRPSDVFEMA